MEKKNYMAPQIKVMQIEGTVLLAGSVIGDPNSDGGVDIVSPSDESDKKDQISLQSLDDPHLWN